MMTMMKTALLAAATTALLAGPAWAIKCSEVEVGEWCDEIDVGPPQNAAEAAADARQGTSEFRPLGPNESITDVGSEPSDPGTGHCSGGCWD